MIVKNNISLDPNFKAALKKELNITNSFSANTIVLLGDSITQNNGPAYGAGVTQLSSGGYFGWANVFLNNAFKVVKNSGIGGNTLQMMIDRIAEDVIAYHPAYCMFIGGINDINLLESSSQEIIAKLVNVFTTLTNAGIKIITSTITPSTYFFDNGNTTAKKAAWFQTNEWIKNYAKENDNIILCDMAAVLVDPVTGRPKVNYTDNSHPTGRGAMIMGYVLAEAIRKHIKIIDSLPIANVDSQNKLTNGLMLGNTNGVADTYGIVATGGVITSSKEVRTDGRAGEWQVVDMTTKATNYANMVSPSIVHSFAIGDMIYSEVEFEIVSGFVDMLQTLMFFQDSSYGEVGQSYAQFLELTAPTLAFSTPISGVLKTTPIAVTSGAIRVRLYIQFNGIAKFRFGRCKISKV